MSQPHHHYLCNRHPANEGLELPWHNAHRNGTVSGYIKWFLSLNRCNIKVDKLQEALDRL